MKYLLFIFLITTGFITIPTHEYYVSTCHIEHNATEKTLEMALNVFSDDLEIALEKEANITQLFLGQDREHKSADHYIFKYIQTHTSLIINDKPIELEYVGKEVALDGMWCYLTAFNIEKMNSISIKSSFLYDTFPAQTNIFHCTSNTNEKSIWLRKENNQGSLFFE